MSNHKPAQLPIELLERIFENLSSLDIKAVRLTQKSWKDVGGRYLFQPFVFRVDRDDFARFHRVMDDSSLSAGIDHLIFETGVMNVFFMSYLLAQRYQLAYISSSGGSYIPYPNQLEQGPLGIEKNAAIKQYSEWNHRRYHAKQTYRDSKTLSSALSRLRHLKRIDVTSRSFNTPTKMLFDAWMDGFDNSLFKKGAEEFVSLLMALSKSGCHLSYLTHDELPGTFFMLDQGLLRQVAKPLQYLHTLHLAFDVTAVPPARFWKGFRCFLSSLKQLKNLRFGFMPRRNGYEQPDDWVSLGPSRAWYVPLQKLVKGLKAPELDTLRLDGLIVCEEGLKQLVLGYTGSLKTLVLHEIGLWAGSFRGLFSTLRESSSLTTLSVSGHLRGIHAESEAWDFHRVYDPYIEAWNSDFRKWSVMNDDDNYDDEVTASHVQLQETEVEENHAGGEGEDCETCKLPDGINSFVTKGGVWPMREEHFDITARDRGINPILHSSACNEFAIRMDDWDEDTRDTVPGWEQSSDLETNEWGDELLQYFSSDGYDLDGFNKEGFNQLGFHYLDETGHDPSIAGEISRARAHREVLAAILSQIPRYRD